VSPRVVIAGVVIAVGGSLWAVLPQNPGSLHDASVPVRWTVPHGDALVAWVLVRNDGPDTITLRSFLPGAPRSMVLGSEVRRGHFPAIDDRWPSPKPAFRPLSGYVVLAHTKATIAVGLRVRPGTLQLEAARVRYQQDDKFYELRIRAPATVVVR
jgi:hypothetical protein